MSLFSTALSVSRSPILQIVRMDEAYTLTPMTALHIRALTNYTNQFGVQQ